MCKLQSSFDDLSFSCGADLKDANLPANLQDLMYVKKLHRNEPIEKLYYAANYDDICVYCAGMSISLLKKVMVY